MTKRTVLLTLLLVLLSPALAGADADPPALEEGQGGLAAAGEGAVPSPAPAAIRPPDLDRLLRELTMPADGLAPMPAAAAVAAGEAGAGANAANASNTAGYGAPPPVPGAPMGYSPYGPPPRLPEIEEPELPPVLALPTARLIAFGQVVPTLQCVPTRACSIELEAGEVIDGYVLGDPTRWQTTELTEGLEEPTPVVVLKPSEFGLRTNLLIVTSRRLYRAELVSPPEKEADGATYDDHVTFWYPEAWAARKAEAQAARARAASARAAATPIAAGFDPTELHWDYAIEPPRRRSKALRWSPSTVFDDGGRTFVRLPPGVDELPAVFGLLDDGKLYPLNARLQGDWLIVPSTFTRAELVVGTGRARRSLGIVRHPAPRGR